MTSRWWQINHYARTIENQPEKAADSHIAGSYMYLQEARMIHPIYVFFFFSSPSISTMTRRGVNACVDGARSVRSLPQKSCRKCHSCSPFQHVLVFSPACAFSCPPQLYISSSDGIGSASHHLPPGHAIFGLFPPIFCMGY